MNLEDYPTPLTDAVAVIRHSEDTIEWCRADFARGLERKLTTIYNLVEGDADGTVDSTPYEKLCNEIVGIIKP